MWAFREKVSKYVNVRLIIKIHSSNQFQVRRSDNKFKSMLCEEQEVFYVAGMRGEKCMQFPGLTKEEYLLPRSVVEIKALGLRQDLNPNSNFICYVPSKKRECCCW